MDSGLAMALPRKIFIAAAGKPIDMAFFASVARASTLSIARLFRPYSIAR
jgi:hypothetical protein